MHLPIASQPRLRRGTLIEHAKLAMQLGLPAAGAATMADAAGYLRFAEIELAGEGITIAWVMIDPAGRVAEVRHLSGLPLCGPDGPTDRLIYGDPTWPMGATKIQIGKPVVFARGAENIIAAFHVWPKDDFVIVGMLADVPISSEALLLFSGRLLTLADLRCPIAKRAFAIWRRQLDGTARQVHTLQPLDRDGRRFFLNASGQTARNLLDWVVVGLTVALNERGNLSN